MIATICGRNREALRWALRDVERPPHGGIAGATTDTWRARDAARVDICDPAKLAAIIAELLQDGEWHVYEDDPGDDLQLPAAEVFVDGDNIGMHLYRTWDNCRGEPPFVCLSIPQSRAFALALLDAPNATTQDIERMIGEATR